MSTIESKTQKPFLEAGLAQVRHLETIFDHFVTEVREYEPQKAICIQKSM
jgi:hypothetical protein